MTWAFPVWVKSIMLKNGLMYSMNSAVSASVIHNCWLLWLNLYIRHFSSFNCSDSTHKLNSSPQDCLALCGDLQVISPLFKVKSTSHGVCVKRYLCWWFFFLSFFLKRPTSTDTCLISSKTQICYINCTSRQAAGDFSAPEIFVLHLAIWSLLQHGSIHLQVIFVAGMIFKLKYI